jgi:hypothetical protein
MREHGPEADRLDGVLELAVVIPLEAVLGSEELLDELLIGQLVPDLAVGPAVRG